MNKTIWLRIIALVIVLASLLTLFAACDNGDEKVDKDKNNTFFINLPEGLEGETVKLYAVFSDYNKAKSCTCDVYLTPVH